MVLYWPSGPRKVRLTDVRWVHSLQRRGREGLRSRKLRASANQSRINFAEIFTLKNQRIYLNDTLGLTHLE